MSMFKLLQTRRGSIVRRVYFVCVCALTDLSEKDGIWRRKLCALTEVDRLRGVAVRCCGAGATGHAANGLRTISARNQPARSGGARLLVHPSHPSPPRNNQHMDLPWDLGELRAH